MISSEPISKKSSTNTSDRSPPVSVASSSSRRPASGKTVIAAEIIKRAVAAYKRVVFIAHRNELLTQARDKLKSFDIIAGIIKAGRDKDARPQSLVQVCRHSNAARPGGARKIDGVAAGRDRRSSMKRITSGRMTYQTIIEAYPDAIIIGLTATPCRGDGRGLGNVFEAMIECPQIGELISLGTWSTRKSLRRRRLICAVSRSHRPAITSSISCPIEWIPTRSSAISSSIGSSMPSAAAPSSSRSMSRIQSTSSRS